jgi:hypothetical protein
LNRLNEIATEVNAANLSTPVIRAVPVRMIESWLLFDENAIRSAASNSNGTADLGLPRIATLEKIPNPKAILFNALQNASELPPRRLQRFRVEAARHRIPNFISDFSPLRALRSFQSFEDELIEALTT